MQISVPRERAAREARVGLVPESVAKLVKGGHTVVVEKVLQVACIITVIAVAGAIMAMGYKERKKHRSGEEFLIK